MIKSTLGGQKSKRCFYSCFECSKHISPCLINAQKPWLYLAQPSLAAKLYLLFETKKAYTMPIGEVLYFRALNIVVICRNLRRGNKSGFAMKTALIS